MEITKQQVLNFNPDDWIFRISSGHSGYDHKDHLNDESNWIYTEDYLKIQRLKSVYEEERELLTDFLNQYGTDNISKKQNNIDEFLDNKFFKVE